MVVCIVTLCLKRGFWVMEGTLSKGWSGWWDEAVHRDPSLTCQRDTPPIAFLGTDLVDMLQLDSLAS